MDAGMFLLESGLAWLVNSAWIVIAIPLFVGLTLLVLGQASDGWGAWLGLLGAIGTFGYAAAMFVGVLGNPGAVTVKLYTWLNIGDVGVGMSLLVDQLSILFVVLVSGMGALVAMYSMGYLAEDPEIRRYFAFINVFIAAMLLLVLADNYVMLFVGWEGVGLASYLLIGFWQERESAALAAKKAFLMNRVADLGLITAIAVLVTKAQTVQIADAATGLERAGAPWVTIVGVGLLVAACGKSAQVPFQSWLPTAMEGPTPASALIHAATMVTAGIYLLLRSVPVFELVPSVQTATALVGVVTLFVGAWLSTAGREVKRVLAGSTMSQVGYMMLAVGLGPVGAVFAVFHVLTHAVFKADLFLSVGAANAYVGRSDIAGLGGLSKAVPWAFAAFTCGYLAIIGVPFLSGYYSSQHIVSAAWDQSIVLGACAVVGIGLTAVYMTRLLLLVFTGPSRWENELGGDDEGAFENETGAARFRISLGVPVAVLSLLAIGGGLALNGWLQRWLEPVFDVEPTGTAILSFDLVSIVSVAVLLVGVGIGVLFYRGATPKWFQDQAFIVEPTAERVYEGDEYAHDYNDDETDEYDESGGMDIGLAGIGAAGLYVDSIIDHGIVAPLAATAAGVNWAESSIVDGGTRGLGRLADWVSFQVRRLQNGNVRTYALLVVVGTVAALASVLIWVWR